MKKHELEITITTGIFFLLMLVSTFIGDTSITGHVVADNSYDTQIALQKALRDPMFTKMHNAKMCIQFRNNDESVFSYKVRQQGKIFTVQPSNIHCEGTEKEDIIATIENYDVLEKKSFTDENDIVLWESKYIKKNGAICDQTFKENYCEFINDQFNDKQKQKYDITCCSLEKKQEKSPWGLLLGILIGGLLIGITTYVFLMNKEEIDETEEQLEELIKYIKNAKDNDYGDHEIKETLINAGWNSSDIDKAFDAMRKHALLHVFDRFEKIDGALFKRPIPEEDVE